MLSERTAAVPFLTRPLYLQVRDALAQRIASGQWKPGVAVSNEGDLAREFGVSAGTMRKALDLLESERLLTRRQGRGTFVNDQASEELAVRYSNIRGPDGEHLGSEVELLDIAEAKANEEQSARLRVRLHEPVVRVRRLRLSDGKPFMLEDVALPGALFPGLVQQQNFSHRIVVLAQEFGILLGKGEERVTISAASEDVAKALHLAPATPILVLDRLVHALDGRPVEWRRGYCHIGSNFYLAELS